MGVPDVIDLLICPHCRQPLRLSVGGAAVGCPRGHSFDLARQGYLNLQTARAPRNADTPAMVAARAEFLGSGAYQPVADRLLELATKAGSATARLLEVGAGTGYYLGRLLDGLTGARGVALDVSVAAARRAAGAHPRLGSVVADVWRTIPVADGSVDLLLDVFAPRNPEEFARVLAPSGLLLCVTPELEHLRELRAALDLLKIQPLKQEQLHVSLGTRFRKSASESLRSRLTLDAAALRALVAMGPNAFHLGEQEIDDRVRLIASPMNVSLAVDISLWSPLR